MNTNALSKNQGKTSYASDHKRERQAHWDALVEGFSHDGFSAGYHRRLNQIYGQIIAPGLSVLEIGCAKGDLLASLAPSHGVGIDFCQRMLDHARTKYPHLHFYTCDAHCLADVEGEFDYIVFSDLVDDLWDVQVFLEQLPKFCKPTTRLVFNFYSHLWNLPLRLAQTLGLAKPMLPQNWLTVEDMRGLLHLTGFRELSHRTEVLLPLPIPWVSDIFNRFLVKLKPLSYLHLSHLMIAYQSTAANIGSSPSVSVIVPARNEAGNIAAILERVPEMGSGTEIIFVEGGSSDSTYEVIEAAIADSSGLNCRLLKQNGSGKGDAVRLGFEEAAGDILMILDADLTVAPEDLIKFFNALADNRADFVNGVRLVYPQQGKAMRFLNLIGNKFFSLAFTWLLGQTVKDTLCGTKAIWKDHYRMLAAQRGYWGELDPFGDFDLLLGAVRLNLRILDIPVRYGERSYGETNISRWSDGLLLLRMVVTAARKIKFI